jgi:hypothetical protein
MTPKNKAEGLVDKMLNQQSYTEELYDAKQCALIAVDLVLSTLSPYIGDDNARDYWQQVKQEIRRL